MAGTGVAGGNARGLARSGGLDKGACRGRFRGRPLAPTRRSQPPERWPGATRTDPPWYDADTTKPAAASEARARGAPEPPGARRRDCGVGQDDCLTAGRVSVKTAPPPTPGAYEIDPPWAWAKVRTTCRPNPVPAA